MKKIEIVSMVRIGGEKIPQDKIPAEQFQILLEDKIDSTMRNLYLERVKTA